MSTPSYSYPDLEIMFADMQTQSTLYRPSAFWENASAQIKAEFCARSVEHFRRLPLALDYFVPTSGSPTNSFTAEQSTGLCKWLTTAHPQSVKSQLALEQFFISTPNCYS